jgi:hypothetical protein
LNLSAEAQTISEIRSCLVTTPWTLPASTTSTA